MNAVQTTFIVVGSAAGVVLVGVLVNLLTATAARLLWRLALRTARSTPQHFDEDHPAPRQLIAVKDDPLSAVYVALKLRRDAGDLRIPAQLRGILAAGRSSTDSARLWLPTAAGALVLTLEIALLLLVATFADDNGSALRGLALALGILIAIDAGPLALTTTAASSRGRWERRTVRTYARVVGIVSWTARARVVGAARQSARSLGADLA